MKQLMATYYSYYKKKKNGMMQLMRFLNREGETNISKNIEKEWKLRVYAERNIVGTLVPEICGTRGLTPLRHMERVIHQR